HPERRGHTRQVRDQHRGRRARDPRHVVVLGHPVPQVAEPLDVLGEVEGVPECLADRGAGRYRGEVEYRERRRAQREHRPSIAPGGGGPAGGLFRRARPGASGGATTRSWETWVRGRAGTPVRTPASAKPSSAETRLPTPASGRSSTSRPGRRRASGKP